MQRGVIRGAAFAVVVGVVLMTAGQAFAGSAPDPRPGDKVLGTKGGITYVFDTEHVTNPAFTEALAACPNAGGRSRITGGGIRIAGDPTTSALTSSRPLDLDTVFGDDDVDPDDYWEGSGDADLGTPVTGYAICAKLEGLRYERLTFPSQPSAERLGTGSRSDGRKVTGGGGFIATTGSSVTSMYPSAKDKWSVAAYDTAGGLGGTTADFVCLRSRHLKTAVRNRSIPPGSADFAKAKCSRKGSHVTGGGALVSGGPSANLLSSSYPIDGRDRDKVPDDGWTATAYNQSLVAAGHLRLRDLHELSARRG